MKFIPGASLKRENWYPSISRKEAWKIALHDPFYLFAWVLILMQLAVTIWVVLL